MLLIGCVSPQFSFRVSGGPNVVIKSTKKFGIIDRDFAYKSLKLISTLDTNQIYPYLPSETYWADMNNDYYGVTVPLILFYPRTGELITNKIVFINKNLIFTNYNNPYEWLNFGMTLSHELSHYFHDTKDPYTGMITDKKIHALSSSNTNFDKEYRLLWKNVISENISR
jgi:hypothetical protein